MGRNKLYIDLIGQEFGQLRVLSRNGAIHRGPGRGTTPLWLVQCECGTQKIVPGADLRNGLTTSCGCTYTPKHPNGTKNPTYKTWVGIIQRCTNPRAVGYQHYGGRGILVCDRWLNSSLAFITDMGERPTAKHSIDRIDNSKGYSPDNCRWATGVQQHRNTRKNRLISIDGVIGTLSEWVEKSPNKRTTIMQRLNHGWEPKRAVFEAVQ